MQGPIFYTKNFKSVLTYSNKLQDTVKRFDFAYALFIFKKIY